METKNQNIFKKSISSIKGIGDARGKLFHKLGVFTIGDLITYYPRDYEDRSIIKNISELEDGDLSAFKGTIASKVSENRPKKNFSIQKVTIKDDTGKINGIWFNQSYIKNTFNLNETYIFFGKINKKLGIFEIHNPVYEKLNHEYKNVCKIVPVYHSTAKLSQNTLRAVIRNALDIAGETLDEVIPRWIRNKYLLSEINYSINNIHFPKTNEDFLNARHRLVFEELLLIQLALMNIKKAFENDKPGIVFQAHESTREFIAKLPFKLTDAQIRVFFEIEKDMESPRVMNRLVQGDVGSGKTVIALLALLKAVNSGYQGAMMAPTEILAEQHYETFLSLLKGTGIRVSLLTGSITKVQKNQLLESIALGHTDIVIGTHALIEENVEFRKLGIVVTDEQHRFGVRQRAQLSKKSHSPDILVMTATPIPRTLALILYGDLDISVIDQLPPGRKPIKTYEVDESMRQRINAFIREKVMEGRQVYIVCPLVEESEKIEAESAKKLAENIANKDFKDLTVGLIYGKIKAKEKERIMKEFVEGKINILVSTTVIEVGVNVPNATLMIIENAERFGLAQLHQLRGRVGRGEHQSYCVLYNQGKNKVTKERMKVMVSTNDGFIISEKDMELRGPGDFFGTRQHGIPEFKIANLYKDIEVLKKAQEAAQEIIMKDRHLESDENNKLFQVIQKRFMEKVKELSMN